MWKLECELKNLLTWALILSSTFHILNSKFPHMAIVGKWLSRLTVT